MPQGRRKGLIGKFKNLKNLPVTAGSTSTGGLFGGVQHAAGRQHGAQAHGQTHRHGGEQVAVQQDDGNAADKKAHGSCQRQRLLPPLLHTASGTPGTLALGTEIVPFHSLSDHCSRLLFAFFTNIDRKRQKKFRKNPELFHKIQFWGTGSVSVSGLTMGIRLPSFSRIKARSCTVSVSVSARSQLTVRELVPSVISCCRAASRRPS